MEAGEMKCAVLGGGPVGLEAALYACELGMDVSVYEAGGRPGAAVRRWGHVELFSPFAMNHTPLGARVLGGLPSGDVYHTGEQYCREYLEPLAEELGGRVRYGARVAAVGKEGLFKSDLIGSEERLRSAFRLLVEEGGAERVERAGVVLDCTGLTGNPNRLGGGGIPAVGERALEGSIEYGLPDVRGRQRGEYAGKTVLLAGDGYSAATTLFGLLDLPGTRVTWMTSGDPSYEVIEDDILDRRAALIDRANALAVEGHERLELISGARVDQISQVGEGFRVRFSGGREIEVDRVVANVGYSPDNSLYRELQVHECYASHGPMKLSAALLGASGADCLAVPSFGPETLENPEPGFYILGSKSYGRGFNFLLRNGYEQVRDVFTLITGDPGLDLYAGVTR